MAANLFSDEPPARCAQSSPLKAEPERYDDNRNDFPLPNSPEARRGRMGEVYFAEDTQLHRNAAC